MISFVNEENGDLLIRVKQRPIKIMVRLEKGRAIINLSAKDGVAERTILFADAIPSR